MNFFDTNPSGRIISRLSNDVFVIDCKIIIYLPQLYLFINNFNIR